MIKLTSNQSIGREAMQFYGKLNSNLCIGKRNYAVLWEINF